MENNWNTLFIKPYFFALSGTMQRFWHMGKQAVAKPTPWVPVLKSLPQMKVIWVIEFSREWYKIRTVFEDIDFGPKIFLILYPSLENSTTHITTMKRMSELSQELFANSLTALQNVKRRPENQARWLIFR